MQREKISNNSSFRIESKRAINALKLITFFFYKTKKNRWFWFQRTSYRSLRRRSSSTKKTGQIEPKIKPEQFRELISQTQKKWKIALVALVASTICCCCYELKQNKPFERFNWAEVRTTKRKKKNIEWMNKWSEEEEEEEKK